VLSTNVKIVEFPTKKKLCVAWVWLFPGVSSSRARCSARDDRKRLKSFHTTLHNTVVSRTEIVDLL